MGGGIRGRRLAEGRYSGDAVNRGAVFRGMRLTEGHNWGVPLCVMPLLLLNGEVVSP